MSVTEKKKPRRKMGKAIGALNGSRRQVLDNLAVGERHFIMLEPGQTVQSIFNHNTSIYTRIKQKFNDAGLTQAKAQIIANDELIIAVMVTRVKESIYD